MKPRIYIDGQEGTTGLQIYERLGSRDDLELLRIDDDKRKDIDERRKLINAADIVFLCLPDAAAVEAASLVENPETRIIDASTAHRTAPGWDYGFAELSDGHRAAIAASKRVANPGCHASGFISCIYPLVKTGLLAPDTLLSCFSLTGYSGGGKKMIAAYETQGRDTKLAAPGIYGITQAHKHLPEMKAICHLTHEPVFCPIVSDYYKGMATSVPLFMEQMQGVSTLHEVWEALSDCYAGSGLVSVAYDPAGEHGYAQTGTTIYGNMMAGRDDMLIAVSGNDERFTVTSVFDNLGKGASGAAVQNMNIMLGLDEAYGLTTE